MLGVSVRHYCRMPCPKGYRTFLSNPAWRFAGGFPKNALPSMGRGFESHSHFSYVIAQYGQSTRKLQVRILYRYAGLTMAVTTLSLWQSSISSLKKCTLENTVAAVGHALYCVRHFWKGQQKQPGSLAKAIAKGRRGADKSVLTECPTRWPGLGSRLFFRPSGRIAAACFPFKIKLN